MQTIAANLESTARASFSRDPERDLREAVFYVETRARMPKDPAGEHGHVLTRLPVCLAIVHRSTVTLEQHPDVLWLGIWTGAVSAWQAVKLCWNAGLRNRHLQAPVDWVPYGEVRVERLRGMVNGPVVEGTVMQEKKPPKRRMH